MYALLLTALMLGAPASSEEGLGHASWHPSDAGLFIEIPDAAAVCSMYDQAPLLRLLNDAEIQRVFQAMGEEDAGVTVSTLAAWVAEAIEIEIPADELQAGVASMSLSLRYAEGEWGMTAIMETRSDPLAAQLAARLEELADEVSPHALSGFKTLSGSSFPADMWMVSQGKRIAMGLSDGTAESLANCWKGAGSSLAAAEAFTQGMEKLGDGAGTPILVASYTGAFPVRENLPDGPVADAIAAMLTTPVSMSTHFNDQRFETTMFAASSPDPSGELFGHAPLKKEWLAELPDDAMLTYVSTLDGSKMATTLKSWIDSTPELAELVDGFDLKGALDDLLAPLGPRISVSMQPIMGLGFPPTYIWVDAEDSAAFAKSFEELAARLGEKVPGIGARTRVYKVKNKVTGERTPISYTALTYPPELAGEMGMFSPKLNFAQLDGRLLFSTSSTALKGELKRMFNGETPEPREFLSRTGVQVPSGTRSVTVFDWGVMLGKLVGIAKLMGPMAGDMVPFDLNLLPQPAVFERYLKPSVHVRYLTEAGEVREHRSPFGLLTWGAAMATGLTQVVSTEMAIPMAPEPAVSGSVPVDQGVEATRSSLRDIKAGIAIYKIEKGELPDSMDLLITPLEGYPKGYLGSLELPQDGWGRDFLYVKEASGYRLWSLGANGVDEGGSGDDVVPR